MNAADRVFGPDPCAAGHDVDLEPRFGYPVGWVMRGQCSRCLAYIDRPRS